jgi:hypothetical protein
MSILEIGCCGAYCKTCKEYQTVLRVSVSVESVPSPLWFWFTTISKVRSDQETGYAKHLSSERENLSLVNEYRYNHERKTLEKILSLLKNACA